MKIEDLNEKQKEFIHNLKHASSTIENDIKQAFKEAKDIRGFSETALYMLCHLTEEARGVMDEIEETF